MVALTPSFTALEPDADSFDVARARIEARGGQALNCLSSDLQGETFDMVCAFEVLEHIEDDAAALQEWRSHVRVGGHLLLSVPAWQHMFGPWDVLAGHYRRYSPDELNSLLRDAGFEPVTTELYGWPLGFIMESIRDRVAHRFDKKEDTLVGQTTHSGRVLQPSKRLTDVAITIGVFPFQLLQRLVPGKGNGIVALARRVR
jgi:SAM-dependent methyltransferase